MSKGFPLMVIDPRGRLSDAVDYVRTMWLNYNLYRPIITDLPIVHMEDVMEEFHIDEDDYGDDIWFLAFPGWEN